MRNSKVGRQHHDSSHTRVSGTQTSSSEQDHVILGDKDVLDFNTVGFLLQSPERPEHTDYSVESGKHRKPLSSRAAGPGKVGACDSSKWLRRE
jgi:hypothetical protein